MKTTVSLFLAMAALGAPLRAQSPSPAKTQTPASSAAPAGNGRDPFDKHQQDPKPPEQAPSNLCVTVEVYTLAQDDAAKLLEENPGGEARHTRALELVAAGKARFDTLLSDVTKSGQRTVVEQADEVRYPTEYTSSPVPGEAPLPTAYETRNVGESLEIEPVMSPDQSACDINMVLNSVHFRGFSEYRGRPQDAPVAQPQFESRKFTTSMTLVTGKIQFLGTQSAPPQFTGTGPGAGAATPSEVRLVFGRVSLVTIAPDASQAQEEGTTLEHQLVFYSVDRDTARQILAGDPKPGSYYDAVRALADKQQAHLERVTVLKTKSGQRAVAEEINEVRYPVEYGIFQKNKQPDQKEHTLPAPSPAPQASGSASPAPMPLNVTIGPIGPVEISLPSGTANKPAGDLEYLPASFETRNTGLTLEIEPVAQKSIVDLNLAPQWVANIGPLLSGGVAGKYPLIPVFEDGKVTTSLSASMGEHAYIGTFSPAGDTGVNGRKDTGKVWLGFIRTVYAAP